MDKPNALIKLLDDLKAENSGTSVVTVRSSWASIGIPGETDNLRLHPEECELLFDAPETVTQLYEALDEPVDATIELHNVSVEDEVLDALNEVFEAVEQS